MPQPTPYERQYNFSDYQSVHPSDPLPASQVDAELNAVKTTLTGTLSNLALLQRDDGKLANQIVTVESLSTAAISMISGWEPRGDWSTGVSYAAKDFVVSDGIGYVCATAHVSGTFATDLAAGKWLVLASEDIATAVAAAEQSASDAADAAALALVAVKPACRVATTENITLSGLLTVDGVTLQAGDRVLVRSQTDAKTNGIYAASASAWSRASDFDASSDVVKGATVRVNEGTRNAGFVFVVSVTPPFTLGSSNIAINRTRDWNGIVSTSTTPRIAIVGDSLSLGAYSESLLGVDAYLTATPWNGEVPVISNISVSGRSLDEMFAAATENLNPLYSINSAMNIAVLQGGSNDYNKVFTAARAASNMLLLSQYLRGLGWRTVLTTMASSNKTVVGQALNRDQWRLTFNDIIRANYTAYGDALADFGADLWMGPEGAYSNTTYFYTDQSHYTNVGTQRMASVMQAAINRIVSGCRFGLVGKPYGDKTSLAAGENVLTSQSAVDLFNTAFGYYTLNSTTSGAYNTGYGYNALLTNTTGTLNVALGSSTLRNTTDGQANTAAGHGALFGNTTGDFNCGFGYRAGLRVTTGNNNVCIGGDVGSTTLTTGSRNLLIGTSSDVDTPAASTNDWLNVDNVIMGDKTTGLVIAGALSLLGVKKTANFNSTADQTIPITLPPGCTRWVPVHVWVTRASVSLTTAAGGIYTGASKTGTALVAASQVYTGAVADTGLQRVSVPSGAAQQTAYTQTSVNLSLTTPQGVAATADVYIFGIPLP